jgi:SAM-dependent methyltransferase
MVKQERVAMSCRFCNTPLKNIFISLGLSPLSNAYISRERLYEMEPFYPLEVYVCHNCFLAQLAEFEMPKNIFSSEYAYFSSFSDTWLTHCRQYAEKMIKRFNLNHKTFVVEIASNDGYLLQYFLKHKIPVLGIEPAKSTAQAAMAKGIPTEIVFFDTTYAQRLARSRKKADLLIGNNVLAHNPNLNDFVEGLRIALKPKGIITMEFPHILKIIENNQFDTIYHEHFSYFSFYTAQKIFISHGIVLFDVEEIPTHGGSLRIYGRHKNDNEKEITSRVGELLERERKAGLLDLGTYCNFKEKIEAAKRNLLLFLIKAKNAGKKVVGYGAPAKGNTLLNFCGIRSDFLDYTVDRNPHKQDKYLPGTHIPIRDPKAIVKDKPDYILILPWNIKAEIIKQMAFIRSWGGKFVIPIPKLEIIE